MCLTASSPEWISRPIEGSAWLANKRRVFGLTNSNDGFRLSCTSRHDSLYAQNLNMRRCFKLNVAGPYDSGREGPTNSRHSYSVCRKRISASGALYRRSLLLGASSRPSAFSFISRSAST